VLAASIFSSAVFGAGVPWMESPVRAQDKATPEEMLQRGQNLFDQKNYAEAKRILNDIDPAQLREDLRAKRATLLTQTDVALAQSMGPNGRFDSAQQDMDAGKLASAASKFQALADDATTPTDVRQKSATQLALVKQQQAARADDMKKLLDQAEGLYNTGKIDDAQNALNTVEMVGADLGWQATPRVKQ